MDGLLSDDDHGPRSPRAAAWNGPRLAWTIIWIVLVLPAAAAHVVLLAVSEASDSGGSIEIPGVFFLHWLLMAPASLISLVAFALRPRIPLAMWMIAITSLLIAGGLGLWSLLLAITSFRVPAS